MGLFHLVCQPISLSLIGELVHALCLPFPEQRDPGLCPKTRSPRFVPRNGGTPFQKAAVTLPGSSFVSSAHHLGAPAAAQLAQEASVGCLLRKMCQHAVTPLGGPGGFLFIMVLWA